jgi:hypothetical protein
MAINIGLNIAKCIRERHSQNINMSFTMKIPDDVAVAQVEHIAPILQLILSRQRNYIEAVLAQVLGKPATN